MRRRGERDGGRGFPFDVPALANIDELPFDAPVTFFVGENGCGKSTLLETIAVGVGAHAIGGRDLDADPTLAGSRTFAADFTFARTKTPRVRAFFRAEDAFGFTQRVERDMVDLVSIEDDLRSDSNASITRAHPRDSRGPGSLRARFARTVSVANPREPS